MESDFVGCDIQAIAIRYQFGICGITKNGDTLFLFFRALCNRKQEAIMFEQVSIEEICIFSCLL